MWLPAAGLVVVGVLWRWRRSGQSLVDFLGMGLVRWYARLWHGLRVSGPAPFRRGGPALVVANHTCSADPAFITAACVPPPGFMLAADYYGTPGLRRLFDYIGCVPVHRRGHDVSGVRAALARLEEGRILGIFPEGSLSNAGRGGMRPGKAGAAYLALKSRAPVYPVWIAGGPQTCHLPPAWLKPSRVRVTFGPVIDLSEYYDRPYSRRLLEEVAQRIMDRIAGLDQGRKGKGGGTERNVCAGRQ